MACPTATNDNSASPSLDDVETALALALFREGGALRDAGRVAEATAALRRALKVLPRATPPFRCRTECDAPTLPPALILSAVHNALGEIHVDAASRRCRQVSLSGADCEAALRHLRRSVRQWPGNAPALASLAGLLHDRGELEAAADLYARAADLPLAPPHGAAPWADEWVFRPRAVTAPFAAFMAALLGSLIGRHTAAVRPLRRLGMRFRLAPNVWDQVHVPVPLPPDPTAVPVRMFPDAIPGDILDGLLAAFAPSAPYWQQTDYERRGYFGFWYELARPPTNLVEQLIRHLLPLTGRHDIVGAEWWVHTRLIGRDMGHQLHYDTEEESIRRTACVLHPILSAVCYLSGSGGGPTVVLDQRVGGPPATHGWLVRPRPGAMMTFPGDLLHGVLPVRPDPESVGQPAAQRLTLMIGWWGTDVASVASREPLGPCGPLPAVSPDCTWPRALVCRPLEVSAAEPRPLASYDGVEEVAPVWEELPDGPPPGATPLALSPATDLLFFARTLRDFERWEFDVAEDSSTDGDDAPNRSPVASTPDEAEFL